MSDASPPILRLGEVDSTSLEAARRIRDGGAGAFWVLAERQTAGRGRRGRSWIAPPGGLTASLALPVDDAPPAETATFSFVAALAVADFLDAALGVSKSASVSLKWPNDALLEGRKVAGVLLEAVVARRERWLIVGIGVNLTTAPQPDALDTPSTAPIALADLVAPPSSDDAMTMLAAATAARAAQWRQLGFAETRRDWLARAHGLGAPLVARLPAETVEGVFTDVDAEGALVLQTRGGARRILAADVFAPAYSASSSR